MTGVPSIVFGLFVYAALVVTQGRRRSPTPAGRARSRSSLLMLPIVIKSSEVVLLLVPNGLREAALALGAPRWRVVMRVVLPAARPGIITGSLLSIARGHRRDRAAAVHDGARSRQTNLAPNKPTNALPIQIFSDIDAAQDTLVTRAWGSALTLVLDGA